MATQDTELMLDVGQANEFKLAARKNGLTAADIKRLSEGDMLGRLLPVIRGHAEVKVLEHIIDCDADPFLPEGWRVEEHQKGGLIKWTDSLVALHLEKGQKNGKWMKGDTLREALKGKKILNANVLDFLLKYPELIPEEWKNKAVFFWGTIYRPSVGDLYVRYLHWNGDRWDWSYCWLVDDWSDSLPAAVRACLR